METGNLLYSRVYCFCRDATLEWVQEELCSNLSRTVLLRAVCMACGLQLALKDYALEAGASLVAGGARGSKGGQAQAQASVFAPDDVLNVLPVISHLPVKVDPSLFCPRTQCANIPDVPITRILHPTNLINV